MKSILVILYDEDGIELDRERFEPCLACGRSGAIQASPLYIARRYIAKVAAPRLEVGQSIKIVEVER